MIYSEENFPGIRGLNTIMADGDYGNLERNNVSGRQEWTGLIGQFVSHFYIFIGSTYGFSVSLFIAKLYVYMFKK